MTDVDVLVRRHAPLVCELRDAGTDVKLEGYASTFSQPYDMGYFTEEVLPGAFKRSLGRNPDVPFLVDHAGAPLARTTSGTLELSEDSTGLHMRALLDPANPASASVISAVRREDMRAMSFAFRVNKGGDAWNEDYSQRQLSDLNIDGGDVSVVTSPANPGTSIGLRSLDSNTAATELALVILLESRAGKVLSAANHDRLTRAVEALAMSTTHTTEAADQVAAVLATATALDDPETLSAPEPTGRATALARRALELAQL